MGYDEHSFIQCEVYGCEAKVNDIHHVDCKGMGGSKTKDYIENLMGLCRHHHEKYGDRKQFMSYLKACHKSKMIERGVQFNHDLITITDELL